MIKYPISARHCGTCKYWLGIRKISGTGIEVDSNSNGKCSKTGNINYNKDTVAYKDCGQWTKL